jgi:tRNA threonylcarbamoyladenosine biosynthesis protein TsaE
MAQRVFEVNSVQELGKVAEAFLAQFPLGGVFLLHGEMGAGKTTFTAQVAAALGLSFSGSPTFSLVNEYSLPNGKKVFHFDLYRLKNERELLDLGFHEYLDSGYWVFIEWPQIAQSYLPENAVSLRIEDQQGKRIVSW